MHDVIFRILLRIALPAAILSILKRVSSAYLDFLEYLFHGLIKIFNNDDSFSTWLSYLLLFVLFLHHPEIIGRAIKRIETSLTVTMIIRCCLFLISAVATLATILLEILRQPDEAAAH